MEYETGVLVYGNTSDFINFCRLNTEDMFRTGSFAAVCRRRVDGAMTPRVKVTAVYVGYQRVPCCRGASFLLPVLRTASISTVGQDLRKIKISGVAGFVHTPRLAGEGLWRSIIPGI